MKKGQISLVGNDPLQITEDVEQNVPEVSDDQRSILHQVGVTIKSYLKAAEGLLKSKYAHIKDWAPIYLAEPGNVLVACCLDGVVIRYERKVDKMRVITAWMTENLPEATSLLSQRLVHCYTDRNYISTIPTTGVTLTLSTQNPTTKEEQNIAIAKIGFDAVIEQPNYLPQPPQKPFCLLSVRNNFEIQIFGELLRDNANEEPGQRFLARSIVRVPVGWECIEVFPFFSVDWWKPEYAYMWAENDILASVVAQQFREAQFQSLDPKATARRQFAELLKSYKELLDSNPEREETLQSFMREHPMLLCPIFTKVWPKLPLGARTTDFVFQEASGDYLLVELERSTHPLFRKDGHTSGELNHARGQITDWKRYLEDNLSTVQRELNLVGISVNPKSLIVIGRSQSLTSENRRKLISIENESPKLKIMTYDDVYENAKAVVENLLGILWDTVGNTQIYYLQEGQ